MDRFLRCFTTGTVIFLVISLETAAQTDITVCEYWPLTLGNEWGFTSGMLSDGGTQLAITDEFDVNGSTVWQMRMTYGSVFDRTEKTLYFFFRNGWLQMTEELEDLDVLPGTAGSFVPIWPEVFHIGDTVPVSSLGMTIHIEKGPAYPECADTLLLSGIPSPYVIGRDLGLIDIQGSLGYVTPPTILGTCTAAPREEIVVRPGGYIERGMPVTLTAPDGNSFQWYKGGVALDDLVDACDGATDQKLVFQSIELSDAGSYICRYDSGAGMRFTAACYLAVYTEVPATGAYGLLCLAVAMGAVVLRRISMHPPRHS